MIKPLYMVERKREILERLLSQEESSTKYFFLGVQVNIKVNYLSDM